MRKVLAVLTVLMVIPFIFGCGKAKETASGFAEKSYSATMLGRAEGSPQEMVSKFYKDGDKMRTETKSSGFTMINIVRQDKKLTWMVFPEKKAYVEQPLSDEKAKEADITPSGQTVKVGEETMDGHPCVKYETTSAQQPDAKTIQWQAKDLHNFPIRIEHQVKGATKSVTQFKDISFGKPAADLFEIPAGYKKASSMAEVMAGGKMSAAPQRPAKPRKRTY